MQDVSLEDSHGSEACSAEKTERGGKGASSNATLCPSTPRFTTAPTSANARSSTGPAPWGLCLAILAYATCFDTYDSGVRARLHQAVHKIFSGQISRIIFVGFRERGTEKCFIRGRCSRSHAIRAHSRSILGHSLLTGTPPLVTKLTITDTLTGLALAAT